MTSVYIVGAGPGDPELMTVKAQRLLREAHVVIYPGSLMNSETRRWVRPEARLLDSAEMTLEEIVEAIRDAHSDGRKVVRLSSGDPSLYGALNELAERLDALGIPYEVVPGVSALTAAAAVLGRELTVPDVAQTVIVTRCEGRTKMPSGETLAELARHRSTMAVFLSGQLIGKVQRELLKSYPPETPVAVVHKVTWNGEQKVVRCRLDEASKAVKQNGVQMTSVILVGTFLESRGTRSKLYDPTFSHSFRKAKESKSSQNKKEET